MINLFGPTIPILFSFLAIAYLAYSFVSKISLAGKTKFKIDNYNGVDMMMASVPSLVIFVYMLFLLYMFFSTSHILFEIFYFVFNLLLFINYIIVVQAIILVICKFNYRSVLGNVNDYKDIMLAVASRRLRGLITLTLTAFALRMALTFYFKGGTVFDCFFFLSLLLAGFSVYFYEQNSKVLGGKPKEKGSTKKSTTKKGEDNQEDNPSNDELNNENRESEETNNNQQ